MPRPYSPDLRERAIAACCRGEDSRSKIARQFQVSEATLYEWLRRWREDGSLTPAPHGGGRTSALDKVVL